jgi:hypothetical protein
MLEEETIRGCRKCRAASIQSSMLPRLPYVIVDTDIPEACRTWGASLQLTPSLSAVLTQVTCVRRDAWWHSYASATAGGWASEPRKAARPSGGTATPDDEPGAPRHTVPLTPSPQLPLPHPHTRSVPFVQPPTLAPALHSTSKRKPFISNPPANSVNRTRGSQKRSWKLKRTRRIAS